MTITPGYQRILKTKIIYFYRLPTSKDLELYAIDLYFRRVKPQESHFVNDLPKI